MSAVVVLADESAMARSSTPYRPPAALRAGLHTVTALLWVSTSLLVALHDAWSPPRAVGFGLLVLFAVLYALSALLDRSRLQGLPGLALLLAEACCVLAAFALLRRDPIPTLLSVVAAQAVYRWRGRTLWLPLALMSAALYAVYLGFLDPLRALVPTLLYGSLQCFAVLLVSTQLRAEQARVALADSNAALRAMQALLEETVRDRERLRIARDLHDVMGHKLTALQINVQVLQQRADTLAASPELERVAQLSRELLTDTRALVRQTGEASGLSLADALRGLTAAFPRSLVEVRADPELRVRSGESAQLLLRAAQEGVTNALRHGHAQHVQIELTMLGGELALRVLDDGRGLAGAAQGFGITQLRERAQALGGSVYLQPLPGSGVELVVRIPEGSAA